MNTKQSKTAPYALQALLDLLAKGWEFPDAASKVVMGYQITYDELCREYDESKA